MKQTKDPYVPPALGTLKVSVCQRGNGNWEVHVQTYKANTLRGDAYWVTTHFRLYAKEADARRFASRFA